MAKYGLKTYLSVPFALSLFLLGGQVSADELSTGASSTADTNTATLSSSSSEATLTETVASTQPQSTESDVPADDLLASSATVPEGQVATRSTGQSVSEGPEVTVDQVTDTAYDVIVSGVSDHIGKVFVPTWSELDGQNDLKWYEATSQGEGQYSLRINLGDHYYNDGRYLVHSYGQVKGSDQLVWLDGTEFTVDLNHRVSATETAEGLALSIQSNGMTDYSKVRFAVWSGERGQDDLQWYQANHEGHVLAPYSNHRGLGDYHIHAYLYDGGSHHWLGLHDTRLSTPQLTTEVTKLTDSQYQLKVSNVPTYVNGILAPTWSDRDGQNDLIWYETEKQHDGTYLLTIDLAKHQLDKGLYHIHVYGTTTLSDNGVVFLGENYLNAPLDHKVMAKQTAEGFELSIQSNATIDPSKVRFAVWSNERGQDDLQWYAADSRGQVLAPYSKHRGLGDYHIHAYLVDNGNYHFLAPETTTLVQPEVATEVIQLSAKTYQVKVSNVPAYFNGVLAPTWSDRDGQNDLVWYETVKQGDGSYLLTLELGKQHVDAGQYHVHLYGQTSAVDGGLVFLGQTGFVAPGQHILSAAHVDKGIELSIQSVSISDYSKVRFAVWSDERGQDDIRWYAADHQGRALASYQNHQGLGKYHVHAYLDDVGRFQFLAPTESSVPTPTAVAEVTKVTDTTYQVTVRNVPAYVTEVLVPTWSDHKGQDDIRWHQAEKQDETTYIATIDLSKHRYDSGQYQAHVYGRSRLAYDGIVWLTASEGFAVDEEVIKPYRPLGAVAQGDYHVINRKVFIDAGHGGKDPGAVYFGKHEKDLNMAIQNLVKAGLEREGYEVILSRQDDTFVELLERSRLVNQTFADLFLSIHFNAAVSPHARGIETYYYEYDSDYPSRINANFHNDTERLSRSAYLAQEIHNETLGQTGAVDNGVRRETFSVLRETTAPAVLVELGYMSNSADFNNIVQPAYQAKLADGIVKGILNYYRRYA